MRFRRSRLRKHRSKPRKRWKVQRRRTSLLRLRQLFQGKVLILLGVVAGIAALLYLLFFTKLLIVQDVLITTEYKDINVERLHQTVTEAVIGEHTAFVNTSVVEQDIYERYPDVSSLSCRRNFLKRRIECDALGYELVAVMKHQGQKYYINENGVVIAFDSRKLGLPLFDLILNPVFAALEDQEAADLAEATRIPDPLETGVGVLDEAPNEQAAERDGVLQFIQPFDDPPVEPLIRNEGRRVFEVTVGKKILDPLELSRILEALQQMEEVLNRKVVHAQYVQVAGELSLRSRPEVKTEEEAEADESPSEESPDHEVTILLDLRRSLDVQMVKLRKSKEVIDFSVVEQIDLSIDGEKIFYR